MGVLLGVALAVGLPQREMEGRGGGARGEGCDLSNEPKLWPQRPSPEVAMVYTH